MPSANKYTTQLISICLAVLWLFLMYSLTKVMQNDFISLIGFATPVFIIYFYILQKQKEKWDFLLLTALFCRLIFSFQFPLLSDDIYRFYFDGMLTLHGQNPYGVIPSQLGDLNPYGMNADILTKMNSSEYFTVYPPLSQLLFYSGALTQNILTAKIIMALTMIVIEGCAMLLLWKLFQKWEIPSYYILWYYLNPLVILEGFANLHFEIIVISTLIAMVYYLSRQSYKTAGFWWAIGIGVKMLPLILLPALFYFIPKSHRKSFFLSAGLILIIIYFPILLLPGSWTIFKSINLYFQTFEFNASIYFLLREIGYWLTGYNLIFYIGPLLALLTTYLIFRFASTIRNENFTDFFRVSLISWSTYLLLASTVHPWYLIPLILYAALTGFRFPILWSAFAILSYIHYDDRFSSYEWMVLCLEYSIVFYFFWTDLKTRSIHLFKTP